MTPGLEDTVVDCDAYQRNLEHLRARDVVLPKIAELADPATRIKPNSNALSNVDPNSADPRNLFRVHWHNAQDRKAVTDVPVHIVLDESITGVRARIVVALGDRFPMIDCHKVLAAYGCLIPRLLSGVFDATRHRAVWPSTGNYCRGGVAISNLLGCRSVAVLPEGMSQERFDWLNDWLTDPNDIYRTPGTESNVKEIYDACHALARDPNNLILNQFAEYGNYIIHRAVTGPSLERIFHHLNADGGLKARAFVAATGSAGTIAAGDHLKQRLGMQIGAIEALECPTMLQNGYGEHNIQGIGDKHVPLDTQCHECRLHHRCFRYGERCNQSGGEHHGGARLSVRLSRQCDRKRFPNSHISGCHHWPTLSVRSNTPNTMTSALRMSF